MCTMSSNLMHYHLCHPSLVSHSFSSIVGIWLEELTTPYYALLDAGCVVTVASPAGGQPPIDPSSEAAPTESTIRFKADAAAQAVIASTVKLSSVNVADFAAVFYPGGHGPLWDLAVDKTSIALIEAALAA
jgi:putative intracellular protease/amidase